MGASDPIKPHKTLVPRGPSTYGSRLALAEPVSGRRFAPTRWLGRDDIANAGTTSNNRALRDALPPCDSLFA